MPPLYTSARYTSVTRPPRGNGSAPASGGKSCGFWLECRSLRRSVARRMIPDTAIDELDVVIDFNNAHVNSPPAPPFPGRLSTSRVVSFVMHAAKDVAPS